MADTMQYDVVSPERSLASGQASEVRIPGSEGDMTAMPDHAPVITTLRPGILTVVGADGTSEFIVTGGFAEVTAAGASILAEMAMPKSEVTAEVFGSLIEEAESAVQATANAANDLAVKYLADLQTLRGELGV